MRNKIAILLFLGSALPALGQQVITGVVVDNLGNPIQSAVVTVEDGVGDIKVTDEYGSFSINAEINDVLNVVTGTDAQKSVAVTGSDMKIMMDPTTESISIHPFIKSSSLENSSASVSRIDKADIEKSSATNLINGIFGLGLGLTSLQNGGATWDEKASFYIRGAQSLNYNTILVVVDGIERPISNLSIDEVESITVLKDAAAVALYGYRGINGVLSVTTKRGMYKQHRISLSYEYGVSEPLNIQEMVNSYDYANAVNEAYTNDNMDARYTPEEVKAFKDGSNPFIYPDVDWVDELIGQLGHSNKYNLTFQGGGEKMRYYTMLDLQNTTGYYKGTEANDGYSNQAEYSKANIRTNIDIDVTNTTKMQANLMGNITEYNHSNIYTNIAYAYNVPSAAYPIKTEDGIWGGDLIWGGKNPIASLTATGYSRSHARTLNADFTVEQDLSAITEGLGATVKLAYDNATTYWDIYSKSYAYASDQIDSSSAEGDYIRYTGGEETELAFTKNLNGTMYTRAYFGAALNYDHKLGEEGNIYSTLMWNYNNYRASSQYNVLYYLNFASYTKYSYKDRYFADLALTYSGSNKLPEDNKFAFSPTVSAAWLISKEDFMKDSSWINYMKLRASYGILHTEYVPEWDLTSASFATGGGYYFGDAYTYYAGLYQGRYKTGEFSPERATKYNVGLEMGMFQGLMLNVDAYYQRRDQIMLTSGGDVSSVFGIPAPYVAAGIVESKGLEIGVDYNKKVDEFVINAGAMFTYAKNKVVEKIEAPVAEEYLATTGLPINQPFGLETDGFFADEEDIKNSPTQLFSEVVVGDIKYKDQNGDGFIDANDYVAMGYNVNCPEQYFSFNLGAEWRGLGFNMVFQGAANYSVWLNTTSIYRPLTSNNNISQFYYDNRWTPETADTALFPRLSAQASSNNTQSSDLWLADASFLKLRTCEIYYNLPKSWLKKLSMHNATIYVRGLDLFSFDMMDLYDPEYVSNNYPTDRSVHVGVKIGF
ncbi:MAG: SusC/RagA family TonB-linked outer membrane protein [Rikenellaceae bacterium]